MHSHRYIFFSSTSFESCKKQAATNILHNILHLQGQKYTEHIQIDQNQPVHTDGEMYTTEECRCQSLLLSGFASPSRAVHLL